MPAVNAKGKYQPWYHESFISDPRVRRMSSLARKTYQTLLHEAFVCSTRPYLPDDDLELELLADCADAEEWLSIQEVVLGMFQRGTYEDQPVLINKRLVEDWNNLLDIREKRSEAGRASGEARRAKSSKDEHVLNTPEHRSFVPNKEVSKLSKEREVSEEDGQGEDMKLKKEIQVVCAGYGVKAGGYDETWEQMSALEQAHSRGAVVRGFTEFMNENQGDDFPKGAVSAYLRVAAGRLASGVAPASVAARDPQVKALEAELIYLSDDRVTFQAGHKVVLEELLREHSPEEVISAFKTFIENKDLNDPKVLNFAAKNFVDAANGLVLSARRRQNEKDRDASQREIAKQRLQEEAEAERTKSEAEKQKEELLFDPLSDTVSE